MTPVQEKVLTELPNYQADCLVQAKTGTGKTIAFLLPALQSLLASNQNIPKGQVAILILSPTRELALQIAKECNAVTAKLQPKIECHTAYGGTSKERDLKTFLGGDPKVLVATPGRLNDYLNDEYIAHKFQSIRTLILDEADQMLEAGFLVALNDILRRLPQKQQANWQGMCFSATIPPKIQPVLSKVLKNDHTRLSTVDPNETPTIDRVPQFFAVVPSVSDVYNALWALLQMEYKSTVGDFKVIVFGTTANGVALMHSLFTNLLASNSTLQVFQLQSRLTQSNRTRTTNEFKEAKAGIMFASDVIGRGMDFPNVSHVVQVGLPSSGDQYVHRVGRTARAGNEGRAFIILTQRERFFLHVNKRLPIQPYPVDLLEDLALSQPRELAAAFTGVDQLTKAKAYQAWLGFNKSFTKQLQFDNNMLVQEANEYARAMGCPEPPLIDRTVVGKMGLRGVQGLNIGHIERSGGGRGGRGGARGGQGDSRRGGRRGKK
ncbi:DEAD-domain-containing protein [Pseudovirgaria hyperparasitica]|uniref:ATP-dependent RNA helicase n=1 Tax=Pseudovirgaria hyperparasitica TaxID=470096 RepID=A0A6A6WM11_9PEZI|nr:DEAD-domain-containing protein [Pseudovirgaria hyperparasitica]KAF2763250.1 DEAD-domain-containing protein [Pseudovirgaria hyperparasitica]